jgi:phytoene dehydrogenase-like protein
MTGQDTTIIVGGGHNGLVAAFYLARAGLRPVVLERRSFVGGACVTEEFAPGFRASTGAYVLSMLRAPVWRDLRLAARGIRVSPAGPSLNLLPDGKSLLLSDDPAEAREAISGHSRRDAAELERFETGLGAMAQVLLPTMDLSAPDPAMHKVRDWAGALRLLRSGAPRRRLIADTLRLLTSSVYDYLSERFESDIVKTALGWHAINDSLSGPSSPGTGYVLLHDHASGDPAGGIRQWGFVDGGMGRVTSAMADAATEAGAILRTNACVTAIRTQRGQVAGVTLDTGEELDAATVVSNADPRHTFLSLCRDVPLPEEFARSIRAYRCDGTSMKINLALSSLPRVRSDRSREIQPYHQGILEAGPPLDTLDIQQAQARQGIPAQGSHIELCFPTVHDPSLAPGGHHIATIDVNSQPYRVASAGWDQIKEQVADRVIGELDELMPGLSGAVVGRQVLSPLDLERLLGLTGGHALHGEMTLDQLFVFRPVLHYSDYRTPVDGLYLCGAGTHPGGGVTGANGRNCAAAVLADRRHLAWRQRMPW